MYTRVLNTTSATKIYNGCGYSMGTSTGHQKIRSMGARTVFTVRAPILGIWWQTSMGSTVLTLFRLKKSTDGENSTYIRKHRK